MAGTAVLGRLTWQAGTVTEAHEQTARVRDLVVDLPNWPGHRPGQHVDVRLTAEDGYQAVRSYSIASPPEEAALTLTVERLEDGEVSPFLVDGVQVGDMLEFRGPIGGYFVWDVSLGGPLLLVAGGSGIVPLMSMIRHAAHHESPDPIHLLYSARSPDGLIYRDELERLNAEMPNLSVSYTFTRTPPAGWNGYARRVDATMLSDVAWPPADGGFTYICGPTSFVESAASSMVGLGHEPARVRTERFGPTGR